MGWLFIFLYLLYVWLNKTGKRGQNKAVMATLALSILLWGSSPGGAQCSQLQQLVIGSQLRNVESVEILNFDSIPCILAMMNMNIY